jgi:gliding motility associated protien GldN
MKKSFVLIVLLLLANSFTLLAQNNNETNTITGKDTTKAVSIQNKPDSTSSAKALPTLVNKQTKPDSVLAGKENPKDKSKKAKSAKALKREAKKNSIENLSEKDLAKLAFQHININKDSVDLVRRSSNIPFTNARPYPLFDPDPNNVKFYHRYWRDIDLQDPKNKFFAAHHAELINALLNAIKQKEIKAYSPVGGTPENPTGDSFTTTIPYNQLMAGLSDTAMVDQFDKDGNKTGSVPAANPFTPDKISGYRIKEDVYYDKTRARVITRIVGIAPLVKLTLSSGEIVSIQPLCWIKFKECRNVLVTIDVDPTKKIGDSMDDAFLQRRFYGRIVQESNPEGLRIKDYKPELADQQTEANRIEQKLMIFKKGWWDYTMLYDSSATSANIDPDLRIKKNKLKVTPSK